MASRRLLQCLMLSAGLWSASAAQAALFEDSEARRAIIELRQRIEASRLASETGVQRVVELQQEMLRKSAEENATLRRSLLELQNQIELLRSDMQRLNGQREQMGRELSELQRGLKDLQQSQQALARGVDERVRQLEPLKLTVDGREITVEPEERRAYDAALERFRAGDFVAAQSGLLSLITRFPRSGYLPSALFWLGNAQYATRDYKEAITNFRIMLTAAPDHVRAPEALLAIANCQIELKDPKAARKTLDELVAKYPQSDAAKAGRERLVKLPT